MKSPRRSKIESKPRSPGWKTCLFTSSRFANSDRGSRSGLRRDAQQFGAVFPANFAEDFGLGHFLHRGQRLTRDAFSVQTGGRVGHAAAASVRTGAVAAEHQ